MGFAALEIFEAFAEDIRTSTLDALPWRQGDGRANIRRRADGWHIEWTPEYDRIRCALYYRENRALVAARRKAAYHLDLELTRKRNRERYAANRLTILARSASEKCLAKRREWYARRRLQP